MKERGILFTGDSVCAIQDGRKTHLTCVHLVSIIVLCHTKTPKPEKHTAKGAIRSAGKNSVGSNWSDTTGTERPFANDGSNWPIDTGQKTLSANASGLHVFGLKCLQHTAVGVHAVVNPSYCSLNWITLAAAGKQSDGTHLKPFTRS